MRRRSSRYKDLKQRLQQLHEAAQISRYDPLGQALDDINAWGYLEEQQQARHNSISCYGPKVLRGFLPVTWTAVMIWYKQRGYYFYDRLTLLGIWAARDESDGISVMIGQRVLHYELPFFNPDTYYRRIQEEYLTFYKDSGAPPSVAQQLYARAYDADQRLEIRREIEDQLRYWAVDLERPW
jgi:hypothetical protein